MIQDEAYEKIKSITSLDDLDLVGRGSFIDDDVSVPFTAYYFEYEQEFKSDKAVNDVLNKSNAWIKENEYQDIWYLSFEVSELKVKFKIEKRIRKE